MAAPAAAQVVVNPPEFQTTSTSQVTVPASQFTINMQPGEQWLIVTSGQVTSNVGAAEAAVQSPNQQPSDHYGYGAAPAGWTLPFLDFDFYAPSASMTLDLTGQLRQLNAGGTARLSDLTIIGFRVTTLDPVESFDIGFSQGPVTLQTLNTVDPGRRLVMAAATMFCDGGFTGAQLQLPTGAVAPPADGVDQLSASIDLPASLFMAGVDTPATPLDAFSIATAHGGGTVLFSRMVALGLLDTLQVSSAGPVALGSTGQDTVSTTLGPVTPGRPYVALYLVNVSFSATGSAKVNFFGDGAQLGNVTPAFPGGTDLPVGAWRVVTPTSPTYKVSISATSTVPVNAWGSLVALLGPLDIEGTYGGDAGMDAGLAPDAGTPNDGGTASDGGPAEDGGTATGRDAGSPQSDAGPNPQSDAGSTGGSDAGTEQGPWSLSVACGCSSSGVAGPLLFLVVARSGRVRSRRRA
jgi:hypothetical protein